MSESGSNSDPLDMHDEEGWEDVEPDQEAVTVVGLFSDRTFSDVQSMIDDCKQNYDFDFIGIQNKLELDFYQTIKFINYIRREVSRGNLKPDVSSKDCFNSDEFLQPTLEGDALLFLIDDLKGINLHHEETDSSKQPATTLEEGGRGAQTIEDLEREKSALMDELMNQRKNESPSQITHKPGSEDRAYFEGYGDSGIHRTMLEDKIRTEAYGDFILANADKIKGKVVLDIGCGTGILSMFCAKAGAARVIAVDNSSIIYTAMEIIFTNGFQNVITCLHGKIEELTLPVDKVDIIVSEWMGYGLLFEAMFDSVIYARDRYLRPDGLMIPSHCNLRIAAYSEEADAFWDNVYGFDMRAMKTLDRQNKRSRQLVILPKPSEVISKATTFSHLSLHTTTVEELTFSEDFEIVVEEAATLTGFVIWFDMFFASSRDIKVSKNDEPNEWSAGDQTKVAFSTGPYSTRTHWDACIFRAMKVQPVQKGDRVHGTVTYKKDGERGLKVGISWDGNSLKSAKEEWTLD